MFTVGSAPPTEIVITSDTGQGGTTNYTISSVASETSVDLGTSADPAGQRAISSTMEASTTAAAARLLSE
jgi:hypothetical protein